MAKSKAERTNQIREARRKLKEVKRPVQDPEGRTYLKSFYGRTKEDAERAWREYCNPLGEPDLSNITDVERLADLLPVDSVPWWFAKKYWPLKAHLRPNSVHALQQAARHLLPELEDVSIQSMTATVLTEALDRIAAKKTLRNGSARPKPVRQPDGSIVYVRPKPIYKPLSAAVVNKCRSLALEINELASDELGAATGAKRVARINAKWVPIRATKKRQKASEISDVVKYSPPMLWALIQGARGTVAFVPAILGACGLRLNEQIGVRPEDLLVSRVLLVEFQDDGEGELADLKTDNSVRRLPLPEALYELLEPFRFKGARLGCGKYGQPLIDGNLRTAFYRVMRKVGLPQVPPHKLRLSFSSWLENNGCPESVRRRLMGHSDADLHGRYNKASEDLAREWMERFMAAMLEPLDKATLNPRKARLGTKSPNYGVKNGRAKLTPEKVALARQLLDQGMTTYGVGKKLGVDRKTIWNIQSGKTWRDAS